MKEPLSGLTLAEVGKAIERREVTSRAATEAALVRISEVQPKINCFISLEADAALAAADHADEELANGRRRGPLHGVPLAHKDAFDRKGEVMTAGSKVLNHPSGSTATVLERLEAAGALHLGTLNLDEFATGGTGENEHFGRCLNPWNLGHIPGGSSAGPGAAVAARLVYGALGGDCGGSIRYPASMCGVVGLKPTFGRVSRYGAFPLSWTMDCIGPLTRTVEDCALVMQVIAGRDHNDSTTLDVPVPDYVAGLRRDLNGMRIGVATGIPFDDVDPELATLLDKAAAVLRDLGAELVKIEVPKVALMDDLHMILMKCDAATMYGRLLRTRADEFSVAAIGILQEGFLIPATRYLEAISLRGPLLKEYIETVFGRVDVLFGPVLTGPAPTVAEVTTDDPGKVNALLTESARFTRFSNFLGTPALSIPCGFSKMGLPMAYQLFGRPFAEEMLLAVGHAYQTATEHYTRSPDL